MEGDMKFCATCNKEHITTYDYCEGCGHKMLHFWRYKCLECEHGSDLPQKFCSRCGSNLMLANKGIEKGNSGVREL